MVWLQRFNEVNEILYIAHGLTVDSQHPITLVDLDPRLGEWRAHPGIPRRRGDDLLELDASGALGNRVDRGFDEAFEALASDQIAALRMPRAVTRRGRSRRSSRTHPAAAPAVLAV